MNLDKTKQSPSIDGPRYFRLTNLVRLSASSGRGVHNEATLYHDHKSLNVVWHSPSVDSRLKRGCVVALRGVTTEKTIEDKVLRITGLDLVDKPIAAMNPFLTVPTSWAADRESVEQAADLWEQLCRPFQHLLNAVLWDGGRFYRYVTGPASSADYPWVSGGNFRQTVATAKQAALLVRGLEAVSPSVIITAALLLNAGKADDYRLSVDGYQLSERGYWLGCQYTILEWLAVARIRVIVPEALYLSLLHTLIAAWGGQLNAQSTEAAILSVANRLNGFQMLPTRLDALVVRD